MTRSNNVEKFNGDLMINDNDKKFAADLYPTIAHVISDAETTSLFKEFDSVANAMKRKGRMAGFWAIGLVFAALSLASTEYVFHGAIKHADQDHLTVWEKIGTTAPIAIPIVSAIMGILGVAIGSGGLFSAKRKEVWLQFRFMTERIRQFHFQTMVFRFEDIVSSLADDSAKQNYIEKRKSWLNNFKRKMEGRLVTELAMAVDEDSDYEPWLHRVHDWGGGSDIEDAKPLFEYYRELRLVYQINFCTYKLREDGRFLSNAPKRQIELLEGSAFACVLLLSIVHVIVLVWSTFLHEQWQSSMSLVVNLSVILIAFTALAVRSIEQGLQPQREMEHYQHYRASAKAILQRFDAASSQAEKLQAMQGMERLAVDEMRTFLINNSRAKFVM